MLDQPVLIDNVKCVLSQVDLRPVRTQAFLRRVHLYKGYKNFIHVNYGTSSHKLNPPRRDIWIMVDVSDHNAKIINNSQHW